MSNHLPNGTVLPAGLLGVSNRSAMAAFNKVYKNFPLRVGIVIASYPVSDDRNYSKLSSEYDVIVFEQNENVSCTNIVYKNCLNADGLGSIADFFEKTLRFRKKTITKGPPVDTSGQDGAVVLLLCLDGVSDKGVIIGSVCHPDRKTTIKDSDPYLEGEYNGVNIKVNKDGSTVLTFKGATDNQGNPTDASQGNTEVKIETDGSFQVDHKTITLRLDKSGVTSLTAQSDINVTSSQGNITLTATAGKVVVNAQKNVEVNTEADATITAKGTATVEGKLVKLGAGATEAVIKGNTFAKIFDQHVHIGNLGVPTGVPLTPLEPSLSKKVVTE